MNRVRGTNAGNGWDHVCDLSYFFGFFVSLTVQCMLHIISPAGKPNASSPFIMELRRSGTMRGQVIDNIDILHGYNIAGVGKEKSEAVRRSLEVMGKIGSTSYIQPPRRHPYIYETIFLYS